MYDIVLISMLSIWKSSFFMLFASNTVIIAASAAPYIAASATALTGLTALVAAISAWRTKNRVSDVDRIGAAQSALVDTIEHLSKELERERAALINMRRRVTTLENQLTECREAVTELRTRVGKLNGR